MKYFISVFSLMFFFTSCDRSFYTLDSSGNVVPKTRTHQGKYEDKFEKGSTVLIEHYHQTLERTTGGKFIRKQFYPPNKQITHFETYADRGMNIRDGKHKKWWDNGNIASEGQYVNDKEEGEWKTYNMFEGYLSSSGKYLNGEKTGRWKNFDKDGNTISEFNYRNNEKDGVYKFYNKEGKLIEEGLYQYDEIILQNVLIEEEEKKELYKVVERMPMFKDSSCEALATYEEQKKCSEEKMLRYIYGNIKYPGLAREEGIQGLAIVTFVVDKKGKIKDRKVHRGCLLYTSPSPRDQRGSRMPSSA